MLGIPLQLAFTTGSHGVRNLQQGRCRIIGGQFYNGDAATRYIVFFNKTAAAVTAAGGLGTVAPDYWVAVSPGDNDPLVTGAAEVYFDTALSCAMTTTVSGSTQGTTGDLVCIIG